MKCECGFKFAGPGEFRNCDSYMDKDGQWWNVCPKCKKEYKADQSYKDAEMKMTHGHFSKRGIYKDSKEGGSK